MEMSHEKLRKLIDEAYERGLSGCRELKSDDVNELLEKYAPRNDGSQYRVFSVTELKAFREGVILQHMIRGRCVVRAKSNGVKYINFDRGGAIDLASNTDPWDKPMMVVYNPED